MAWGEYPVEYNPRVHGAYDPSRWYGKQDIKFGQLKLSEVPAWIGRRNKTPLAVGQAIGRAYWRWQQRWRMSKGAGLAGELQMVFGMMGVFYLMNYHKYRHHKFYKYHW